jgi:phosphate starvation-inducible PhoH-like protein
MSRTQTTKKKTNTQRTKAVPRKKLVSERAESHLELEIADAWTANYKIKKPYYLTDNHKEFYEALLKPQTRIGFVDGPAGSAKSYLAVLAGLELLEKGEIDNILYIRSVIESASKSIGALPGELDEKFSPYVAPMMEKACEIIGESSAAMLKSRDVLAAIPVNFVRGLTFTNSFVIVDEAQNLTWEELVTILTRCGKNSTYAVCGDRRQADIGAKSGFNEVFQRFEENQSEDFTTTKFGKTDIVRDKILRKIVAILS